MKRILARSLSTLIGLLGVAIYWQVASSLRENAIWLSRDLLYEPRFAFYIWAAAMIGIAHYADGVCSLLSEDVRSLTSVRKILSIFVGIATWAAFRSWRIRTDVGPENGIVDVGELPTALMPLAEPYLAGGTAFLLVLGLFLALRRQRVTGGSSLRNEPS